MMDYTNPGKDTRIIYVAENRNAQHFVIKSLEKPFSVGILPNMDEIISKYCFMAYGLETLVGPRVEWHSQLVISKDPPVEHYLYALEFELSESTEDGKTYSFINASIPGHWVVPSEIETLNNLPDHFYMTIMFIPTNMDSFSTERSYIG